MLRHFCTARFFCKRDFRTQRSITSAADTPLRAQRPPLLRPDRREVHPLEKILADKIHLDRTVDPVVGEIVVRDVKCGILVEAVVHADAQRVTPRCRTRHKGSKRRVRIVMLRNFSPSQ